LLDALSVSAVNAYSKLDLPEVALLLLEFHGSDAGVAEQAAAFGEIASDCGGSGFDWTTNAEERNRLWKARHDYYWAALQLRPGATGFATDVCVPISRLAECVGQSNEMMAQLELTGMIVGHAGDGNFHTTLLVDMSDPAEIARAEEFVGRLNEVAISMDGTCTGEHGIGQGKRPYLVQELGPATRVMAAIKNALDPDGIMNPGKILPD
jgi:D-lactate dehydrogenase (cytochrome)